MIAIKFCFYEETDGGPANVETTLDRLVSFNSTASLLEILDLKYFSSSCLVFMKTVLQLLSSIMMPPH